MTSSVVNASADEPQNKFLSIVLAVQRATQLKNGARPRVDAGVHKLLWVAVREVQTGMVSWDVGPKAP
jgi:DNA-directed RNA polymerase subunit K/omega